MAAVFAGGEVGNLLAVVPGLQILTWALQVMPVFFFFVGGFSHALSYRSLSREHAGSAVYSVFVRARLHRLLRPTMVFVLVWGAAALAIQSLGGQGGQGGLTGAALRLVAQPLWFIGIYLAMVAFTPPLLKLHARYGWAAFAAPALAAAAALTALCVAAFRSFERPARGALPVASPGRLAGPAAAAGVTLCLLGVLGLSAVGFGGLLEGRTAMLVAVRISAPAAVVMALAGWLLVEAAGRARTV